VIIKTKFMPNVTNDRELLEAALRGLEARRANIDEHIRDLQRLMNGTSRVNSGGRRDPSSGTRENDRTASAQSSSADGRTKRSQAGKRGGGAWTPERRRRMAEAMKRRWADGSIKRALKRARR
jgi:hypothetical protein